MSSTEQGIFKDEQDKMVLTQSLLNVLNVFKYKKMPHENTLTLALNYSKCNLSPTGAKFETLENNKVYTKM